MIGRDDALSAKGGAQTKPTVRVPEARSLVPRQSQCLVGVPRGSTPVFCVLHVWLSTQPAQGSQVSQERSRLPLTPSLWLRSPDPCSQAWASRGDELIAVRVPQRLPI